jgi:hypothetical protein
LRAAAGLGCFGASLGCFGVSLEQTGVAYRAACVAVYVFGLRLFENSVYF